MFTKPQNEPEDLGLCRALHLMQIVKHVLTLSSSSTAASSAASSLKLWLTTYPSSISLECEVLRVTDNNT